MKSDTILFDINETVLDLSSLKPQFKLAFGDDAILSTWFSKLLHSSTVCCLTDVKTDFASLAKVALARVAGELNITLTQQVSDDIISSFAALSAHADVKDALQKLRTAGFRCIAFSNSSEQLITAQINNAGLADYFDDIVSVEQSGSFKPDRAVYQFGANRVHRAIESLWLVATHDWDTHGAISAGMRGAYIDRRATPYHPLYRKADIEAKTMAEVADKIITLTTSE